MSLSWLLFTISSLEFMYIHFQRHLTLCFASGICQTPKVNITVILKHVVKYFERKHNFSKTSEIFWEELFQQQIFFDVLKQNSS